MTKSGKVYIVIASHGDFGVALDQLLQSLRNVSAASFFPILIAFAGDTSIQPPGERVSIVEDVGGATVIRLRNNIFEYTALMAFHEFYDRLPDSKKHPRDAVLLLHDTSHVGHSFVTKVQALYRNYLERNVHIQWANSTGQCNLGLFSPEVCQEVSNRYKNQDSMDKMIAIDMEHNRHPASIKRYPFPQNFASSPSITQGYSKVYSDRMVRCTLYFPELDVRKHYGYYPLNDGTHHNVP